MNCRSARWTHFAVFLIFLGLLGCAGTTDRPDSSKSSFHYNQPNSITSLDPAFARNMTNMWAVNHLFSKLVRMDDKMGIVGDLAHSWDVLEDGTLYRFYLKSGVLFHSTGILKDSSRVLTAEDVVFSFSRICSPEVSSPGSWIFKDRIDRDRPFYAVNDSTFELKLERPFAPILSILTMEYCSIVCPEAVVHYGNYWRSNPIGTGPYSMDKWVENEGLFLRKNESYELWNDTPHLPERVRVSFMRDRKTALIELLGGNLDFISGYDPTYRALLLDDNSNLQTRHSSQIHLIKSPFLNTEYLGINLELAVQAGSPLANLHFRKALSFGVDRKRMISSLNGGIGFPAHNGFIPKGMPGYDTSFVAYEFNPDSVIYHLDRSGYNGEVVALLTNRDYLEKCLFMSRQWEHFGINVKVELLESSVLRDRMRNGEALFFRASWIADYPDAENYLIVFKSDVGAPPNYTRFASSRLDSLYSIAVGSSSISDRIMNYQLANREISNACPTINLYYDQSFWLLNNQWGIHAIPSTNILELDWLFRYADKASDN